MPDAFRRIVAGIGFHACCPTLYGRVRYPLCGGCRSRPMQPMGSRQLDPKGCGAMGLGDCTIVTWGFYTDPVSPATLFDLLIGILEGW